MALTGNMIAEAIGGNASIVNYCMFVAVISMLALFYLFTVSIKPDFAILPILPLVLDALLTLFFLIGGIALAAELNVHSCSSSVSSETHVADFAYYTDLCSGLSKGKPRHKRVEESRQAMPRGTSCVRVPLVRFRRLYGIISVLGFGSARWKHAWAQIQRRCASNVPGLNCEQHVH